MLGAFVSGDCALTPKWTLAEHPELPTPPTKSRIRLQLEKATVWLMVATLAQYPVVLDVPAAVDTVLGMFSPLMVAFLDTPATPLTEVKTALDATPASLMDVPDAAETRLSVTRPPEIVVGPLILPCRTQV